MSTPDDRRPARLLVLSTVIAVVAGVAVLSAVLSVPAGPTTPNPPAALMVAPTDARASSSFCAAGTGTAAGTTDFLTNTTPLPVLGSVTTTVAAATGPVASRRPVYVPPLTTSAVDPDAGLPGGSIASTLAFSGGGVAVDQEVSGAAGWSVAPCASSVATEWLFPSGSTAGGDSLTLSLFNPTASAAMADVSFLTSSGLLTPQPFQGLVVGAGQLVDEDVGSYAQSLPEVATVVTVISGALVGDELQQWAPGPASGLSLQLGTTGAATDWHFAATTVTPGSAVAFDVANPSSSPVTVTFSATLPSATVLPRTLEVAGSSTASFTPSSTPGWPRGSPFAVAVRADGPVVVGRTVMAAAGSSPPVRGLALGTSSLAARWLVPAAALPGATGGTTPIQSLSMANPGSSPARATIASLGRPRRAVTVALGPGQLAVLARQQIPGDSPYVVTATSPIVVDADLPSGAPGVATSPAFLLSGRSRGDGPREVGGG